MKEKKKVSLALVIIFCFCAVVWTANLIADMAFGYTSSAVFVLHVISAIVGDACAVAWIILYFKSQKNNG